MDRNSELKLPTTIRWASASEPIHVENWKHGGADITSMT